MNQPLTYTVFKGKNSKFNRTTNHYCKVKKLWLLVKKITILKTDYFMYVCYKIVKCFTSKNIVFMRISYQPGAGFVPEQSGTFCLALASRPLR